METKIYSIGFHTKEDWESFHHDAITEGSHCESTPERCVCCADEKLHSETRGCYELTEEEAKILSEDPKVKYINLDPVRYPEIFKPNARDLYNIPRYDPSVKHYRDFENQPIPPVTSAEINRSGYQLLRGVQRTNPWEASATTVLNDAVEYTLDGTDVDVIVGDDGCWFGHPEFSNNTGDGPITYIGGNLLKSGFSPSATTGTCDLLDLVLDAPYYLDPDWFEADPANRLILRWDGTTVPVDSVARDWWTNSSQRSSSFLNAGVVGVLTTKYTRDFCNGSNSVQSDIGDHGTPCCALTYGRTHGWAFNSNKWFVNAYNTNGTEPEAYFDMMKIFHQNKPINPKYGNKNPTISSNSWGYRTSSHRQNSNPASPNYYFYRKGTSGGVGVAYTAAANVNGLTQGTIPNFMRYVGWYGDSLNMKGEHTANSILTAGEEMINAGVIFVGAAGNSNQKQVSSKHPDYNNYWSTNAQGQNSSLSNSTHLEFGITTLNTTNRRGFPQQLGKTANEEYPVINIGALDDDYQSTGLERKVDYSDMGDEIDVYAPADGTLAANRGYTSVGTRPDSIPGSAVFTSGKCLLCTNNSLMTNGKFTSLLTGGSSNIGVRFTTTSGNVATGSTIPSVILGATGISSTTPDIQTSQYGPNDDGFWSLTIPWNINFGSTTTNEIYVNTNSYVTFGSSPLSSSFEETIQWTYDETSVPHPKMYIFAADGSAQRIWTSTSGITPNRTFTVRFEGHINYQGGVLGSPTTSWELTFYENSPSQIDLQIDSTQRVGPPTDCSFSGTSAACPVACGMIATIMQEHREWDWRQLKKYLRTSMLTQTSTRTFYQGNESRTATDANWADVNSLEGGKARIIYNPQTNL
jgi:hypothetical protein